MSLANHDLIDLVGNKIHIDSFVSKMGRDEDIITLSFKVKYKDPAEDLVDFFEKGYDWILDADVSSGTVRDGSWLVFAEFLRRPSAAKKIVKLVTEMENITAMAPEDYIFRYKDSRDYYKFEEEIIEKYVPLTPRAYNKIQKTQELDEAYYQSLAGIKVNKKPTQDSELADYINLSKPSGYTKVYEEAEQLVSQRHVLKLDISPYELMTVMREYRSQDPTYNKAGNNAMVTFYSPEEKIDFERFLSKKGVGFTDLGED